MSEPGSGLEVVRPGHPFRKLLPGTSVQRQLFGQFLMTQDFTFVGDEVPGFQGHPEDHRPDLMVHPARRPFGVSPRRGDSLGELAPADGVIYNGLGEDARQIVATLTSRKLIPRLLDHW